MAPKVTWWEVIGQDGKKLQEFYGNLFEWKVDANNPMSYGMVDAEQTGVGGGIATGQGGQSHVTVYVEVDDLQATLDKAESLGGKTIQAPMVRPGRPDDRYARGPGGSLDRSTEGRFDGLAP